MIRAARRRAAAAALEKLAGQWGLLAALGAFLSVVLAIGMRAAIPMLSYDDIYRALFAHEWARRPFFFTYLLQWLPFPLIATGVVVRLTGEVFWTSLGVDVGAAIVCLCYLHRTSTRLFGSIAAWSATSLFGLTPWVVFLALSRYSEPILLAATAIGVFHWLRWSDMRQG